MNSELDRFTSNLKNRTVVKNIQKVKCCRINWRDSNKIKINVLKNRSDIFQNIESKEALKILDILENKDELPINFIIGSYHKTGSTLWSFIWYNLLKNCNINYIDSNHFNEIPSKLIDQVKSVVLIRNPYEIIMSGMRYHCNTDEEWYNIKRYKFNNLSYKEYINLLSHEEKILFEMSESSYHTIMSIYNDIKYKNTNNQILFVQLEKLLNKEEQYIECKKICNHLNIINLKQFQENLNENLKNKHKKTKDHNDFTYKTNFTNKHIFNFNKLFPEDLLEVMGYINDKI